MDRRTVGLGVAAALAVGAAVGVTVDKRHTHTSRDDVAAYIKQVNAVQDDLRYPLTKVATAYKAFAGSSPIGAAQARALATAEQTLKRVERRTAALDPPPPARHLHALLLRLIGDEAAVTREVAVLARFMPGFKTALATVRKASVQLTASLAKVHAPTPHALKGTKAQILKAQKAFSTASAAAAGAQADAVDAYDAQLRVALRQLSTVTPPAAFAPAYRTQRFTLSTTRVAGAKLATALRSSDRADVPELGRAFTLSTRKSQAISAQRAEIAAVRAYNARVRALSHDAGAVQAEVLKLQRTLP